MLDHCVKCGCRMLTIVGVEEVMVDASGLTWSREDLRCPECGWTDADFVTEQTPPLTPPHCVGRGIKERRRVVVQANPDRVRGLLKGKELSAVTVREAVVALHEEERETVTRRVIRNKIKGFGDGS